MSILVGGKAELGIFREDVIRLHQIGTVVIIDEFPDMVDNDFITRSIMGSGQAQFGLAKTMDAMFVLSCWLAWRYDRDKKVSSFVDSKRFGVNGIDLVNAVRVKPWVYKGED
jgi:hypothetical protein